MFKVSNNYHDTDLCKHFLAKLHNIRTYLFRFLANSFRKPFNPGCKSLDARSWFKLNLTIPFLHHRFGTKTKKIRKHL